MTLKRLCFLILLVLFFSCNDKKENGAPNVIIVMTDDQGYGEIGAHGNPHIHTPNLDLLHSQSVRLNDFHVGTTCAPTRAALMTGRDGNRVGVWHTIAGRSQLDRRETTMAEIFKDNGYRTGMFGKWHLGDSYPFRPHDRGFDEALYHGGGGIWQGPDYWDNDYFDDTYYRNGEPEKKEGYCTDVWFDEAIEYMSRKDDKPFFAYITPNSPHFPFHVDSTYIKPYLNNSNIVNPNFYGMITNIDENMGKLMRYLDDTDQADNTILIFMTDNGSAAGSHIDEDGYVTSGYNANMRGKKVWQYEGGHRVPCFVRWPNGQWEGGRDIDYLTAHIDILPTLMDGIGIESKKELDLYGSSLSGFLKDEITEEEKQKLSDRVLIVDTQRRQHPKKWDRSCVMMGQWRMINGKELYHIGKDPGQRNDIANNHAGIISLLSDAYNLWWTNVSSTFDHYTRSLVGDEETILYAHDWINAEINGVPNISSNDSHVTPWNQTHIRKGEMINGEWYVEFGQSGLYSIEMRRWPKELDVPIQSELPPKKSVDGGEDLPKGISIMITSANVAVDGQITEEIDVKRDDNAAVLSINVEKGTHRIKASFETEDQKSLGAYYVYIKKKV